MNTGIYKITAPDGKVYIGQAKNINNRFYNYRINHSNCNHPRLNASFEIYGIDNHSFELIYACSKYQLDIWERYYQDVYDVLGINGLNCRLTPTKELKGKMHPDSKQKMIASLTGRKHSGKALENIKAASKKRIGIKKNPVAIRKQIETRKRNGKKYPTVTDDTRQKISESLKGRNPQWTSTENFRKRVAEGWIQRKQRFEPSCTKLVLNFETGIFYNSNNDAAASIGVDKATMCLILNGKRKKRKTEMRYV